MNPQGARMVTFAGYLMPMSFPAGILKEHLHTRAAAGLFDVSHMGQVWFGRSQAGWRMRRRRWRRWCRWTCSALPKAGSATGSSPTAPAASSTT